MAQSGSDDVETATQIAEAEARIAELAPADQRLVRAIELAVRRMPAEAKRGRDWDAYAAVIASFIGILALAIAGYTAYVQRQQLRAQIWPHLQLEYSSMNRDFHAINQGTGPARVTAMRVAVGGVVVKTWAQVEQAAGGSGDRSLVISSWLSKAVVPADKEFVFARAADSDPSRALVDTLLPRGRHAMSVTVCYCSVLEDCWVTALDVEDDETPGSRASCPIPVSERFAE